MILTPQEPKPQRGIQGENNLVYIVSKEPSISIFKNNFNPTCIVYVKLKAYDQKIVQLGIQHENEGNVL